MLIGENDWRRHFSYRGAVHFDIGPVHRNAWMNNRFFIDKAEVSRNNYGIDAINANHFTAR